MQHLRHEESASRCQRLGDLGAHKFKTCPLKERFDCEKNNLEMFSCSKCDFKTEISILLRKHNKEVHENETDTFLVNSYTCKNSTFETYSSLQWIKHCVKECKENFECLRNVHQFACNQCTYITHRKNRLKLHKINKHTPNEHIKSLYPEVNWFQCDQCSYTTRQKSHLKDHKITKHTSENDINWFHCDQCSYKAKLKSYLKIHKISMHISEKDINWFECDQCSYKSKHNSHLHTHKISKHNPEEDINWFGCEECSFKSKRKSSLKRHKINKHTADKNIHWFECDQCPYRSKRKSHLKRHEMQKHITIKGQAKQKPELFKPIGLTNIKTIITSILKS